MRIAMGVSELLHTIVSAARVSGRSWVVELVAEEVRFAMRYFDCVVMS